MKIFLTISLITMSLWGFSQDDVFILDSSQSMVLTGKGIGQDGAINPYLGSDCIAVVENLSKNEFSIRIQQNGKIKDEITVKAGEIKEISLGKDEELYIDTDRKAKARVNFKLAESMDNQAESMTTQSDENLLSMIQKYVDYNLWANEQYAEWLSTATQEQLNMEIVSSYKDLEETIKHIWSAEYLWLQVVKDESYQNNPAKSFDGSKEELLTGWIEASKNFNDHVKNMSVKDLQEQRPRSEGNGYTLIADMIHHCMNHSTQHRGQLITMGRQAGLKAPPRTDFIYFVGLEN